MWTVIGYFGYPEILDELNGSNLHSLRNVLTLEAFVHTLFDALRLWLEPTVRLLLSQIIVFLM